MPLQWRTARGCGAVRTLGCSLQRVERRQRLRRSAEALGLQRRAAALRFLHQCMRAGAATARHHASLTPAHARLGRLEAGALFADGAAPWWGVLACAREYESSSTSEKARMLIERMLAASRSFSKRWSAACAPRSSTTCGHTHVPVAGALEGRRRLWWRGKVPLPACAGQDTQHPPVQGRDRVWPDPTAEWPTDPTPPMS